jgi:hypothetical protein
MVFIVTAHQLQPDSRAFQVYIMRSVGVDQTTADHSNALLELELSHWQNEQVVSWPECPW